MAEAFPGQFEDSIQKILECAICLEQIVSPRILPCQHVFCRTCLETLVRRRRISCPICRHTCNIRVVDVSRLPRNLFLENYLDNLCWECKGRPKEKRCAHCDKDLCGVCYQKCELESIKERQELHHRTGKLIETGYNTLHQILTDIVKVHQEMSAIVEDIDKSAEAIVDSTMQRHQQLKHDILKIGNAEIKRLDKHYEDSSSCINNLKRIYIPDRLRKHRLVDCQQWDQDNKMAAFLLQNTSRLQLHYNGNIENTLAASSSFGKLQTETVCDSKATMESSKTMSEEDKGSNPNTSTNSKDSNRFGNGYVHDVPHLVFGQSGSGKGWFKRPSYVDVSPVSGHIVICDNGNCRIQIFTGDAQFLRTFGSRGTILGSFDFGTSYNAGGVTVTTIGLVVVADTMNHRLQIFTERGEFQKVIGCKGTGKAQFHHPIAVTCDKRGQLYVCDMDNGRIQVLNRDGHPLRVIRQDEEFWCPTSMAVYPNGEVIVASNKLEIFSATGKFIEDFGIPFDTPFGITIDVEGNVLVNECVESKVYVLKRNGAIRCTWGSCGNAPGEFAFPVGIACTGDGGVIIVDPGTDRAQIFYRDNLPHTSIKDT